MSGAASEPGLSLPGKRLRAVSEHGTRVKDCAKKGGRETAGTVIHAEKLKIPFLVVPLSLGTLSNGRRPRQ